MPGPINKAVTILGATTRITSITFARVGEKISARAEGEATRSDGTIDQERAIWFLSGAAETTVRNVMDGLATQKLREKMGLEAP